MQKQKKRKLTSMEKKQKRELLHAQKVVKQMQKDTGLSKNQQGLINIGQVES